MHSSRHCLWGSALLPFWYMPIAPELLEILACPVDHAPVRETPTHLVCSSCGRRYPIREGIPVMLVDEAEPPAS